MTGRDTRPAWTPTIHICFMRTDSAYMTRCKTTTMQAFPRIVPKVCLMRPHTYIQALIIQIRIMGADTTHMTECKSQHTTIQIPKNCPYKICPKRTGMQTHARVRVCTHTHTHTQSKRQHLHKAVSHVTWIAGQGELRWVYKLLTNG